MPADRLLQRGFTLVELIMVMVIAGVIGATLLIFLKPAIDSYFDTRRRAGLTDLADTALRRVARDIRVAVPNSIRSPASNCVEFIPTSTGGRYRMADDPDTIGSKALDIATAVQDFDVLTSLNPVPAAGDWVVIGNQDPAEVYGGSNREAIASVSTPASSLGKHRISLSAPKQFPSGYDGGRFYVIPDAQQAVFYVCSNPGTNAQGTGTGTLYRLSRYGFNASAPAACPGTSGGAIVAEQVSDCNFVYTPNRGATQQSGFVWIHLELAEAGERIALAYGAHVVNTP